MRKIIRENNLKTFSNAWISKTNVPLALLGIAYLAIYSVQVIQVSDKVLVSNLERVGNAIWLVFVVDLIFRFISADSLGHFFRFNFIEIAAVSLPFLRVLRMLRVLLAVRGLKIFVMDRSKATGLYIALLAPLTWFMGAIVVLDVESKSPDAAINNLGEALWWSLTTITTVGYGDLYPTTVAGKFVAAILMILGISLFSAGAAMFASWILRGDQENI